MTISQISQYVLLISIITGAIHLFIVRPFMRRTLLKMAKKAYKLRLKVESSEELLRYIDNHHDEIVRDIADIPDEQKHEKVVEYFVNAIEKKEV